MAKPLDFRGLDEGFGGDRKRKRSRADAELDEGAAEEGGSTAPAAMAIDDDKSHPDGGSVGVVTRGAKRAKYDFDKPAVVVGSNVSRRAWKKQPAARSSSKSRPASLSTNWDQKMAAKKAKKQFQEQKKSIIDDVKAKKKAERERRQASKKRKEENSARSAITQTITNPKKLKKMSKRQLAQLKKI